jgi:hypothetical protein
MSTRAICLISILLCLGTAVQGATIHWTGAGNDRKWDNPKNWEGGAVPGAADEVYIDVPPAVAGKGPILAEGVTAKISGLGCEVAGEPTMTMTGGTLEIGDWIWWGDGAECHGTFEMSGGTITVVNEHELGWGGGSGTWTMTDGTVSAGKLVIPTATGKAGQLYLRGGTYKVGSGGLSMTATGLIDITEGTLLLEGDHTAEVQGFSNSGRIIAYGGEGYLDLDYDVRNPEMTTLTGVPLGPQANRPDPADGARAVAYPLFKWYAGRNAVLHDVYVGTSPDTLTLMVRQSTTMYWYGPGLTPGTVYYWRVDEVEADGTTINTGNIWSFTAQALTAYYPDPADGANDAAPTPVLTWLPGQMAVKHHVYFGDSLDAVSQAAAETDQDLIEETTFAPGDLESAAIYFWRVDEVTADGSTRAGSTWRFATFLAVDDFESYNDEENQGTRIYETWIDGYADKSSGAIVGHFDPPFAEQTIIHGGGQSMPLDYNNVDSPFYSEAQRTFATAQDWTVNDVNTLVLYIRGTATNDPAPLYVGLEDASRRSALVAHPEPAVVTAVQWTEWRIPLSRFTDVDMGAVKKIYLGVGNREDPTPGGHGTLYIDDLRLVRPVPVP